MKSRFEILITFFLISIITFGQSSSLKWARGFGSSNWDVSNSVTYDNLGNVYVTGYFKNTVDFDPGAGIFNLTSNGNNDVFVLKLDINGQFKWAKNVGGFFDDEGLSIDVDNNGNVFATGKFESSADFDPNATTFSLTSVGSEDAFILKLDSLGNFKWAMQIGSINDDAAFASTHDNSGNCFVTGQFSGIADFDPSSVFYNLVSSGAEEAFVLKLDNNGNFIWAKKMGGLGGDGGRSIALDNSGNVLTGGIFSTFSADFDPGVAVFNLTNSGQQDAYISKLDPNGNFIWAKGIGGPQFDYVLSLALDNLGNVYATGSYSGTVDFDPGASVFNLTSTSNNNVFVLKLYASGNFSWAKGMGNNPGANVGKAIAVDSNANVYTTGAFVATVDFDPSSNVYNMFASGAEDVFLQKLDSLGNFQWVRKFGGNSMEIGYSVKVDSQNSIYLAGLFNGVSDFDPNSSVVNLTSNGTWDAFVVKLSQCQSLNASIQGTDVSRCFGGSNGSATVTPTASGSYLYLWSPGGSTASVVSGLSAGNYSCSITDACGAKITKTLTINQPLQTMTLNVSNSHSFVCSGFSSSLTANCSGGVAPLSYSWSNGANSISTVVNPTTSSVYTVSVTDASLCVISNTISVNVDTIVVSATSGSICSGQSYTFNATGVLTYTWNNGVQSPSLIVNPLTSSNYTVYGTSNNGCVTSASVTLLVVSTPTISAQSSKLKICINDTTTLLASGALTYSWNPPSGLSAVSGSITTAGPLVSTIYTVTGYNSPFCSSQNTISIIVNQLPLINVTGSDSVCKGMNSQLVVSGIASFTISPTTNITSIQSNTVNILSNLTQTYNIVGVDTNLCSNNYCFVYHVIDAPSLQVQGNLMACENSTISLVATGADSYIWQSPFGLLSSTNSLVTIINSPLVFTLTAINNPNCVQDSVFTIQVLDSPTLTLVSPDSICPYTQIQLSALSNGNVNWTGTGAFSCTTCSITNVILDEASYVYITVTGTNSCRYKDSIYIDFNGICDDELIIPNVFTPNGDNVNDVFLVKSSRLVDEFNIVIYDRWGLIMFESEKLGSKWDGYTPSGIKVSDGIYYYVLNAKFKSGKKINRAGCVTKLE